MSIKALFAAVVLAVVLIIAAFFLNRANPGTLISTEPTQLLDFKPAQVVRIIASTPETTHTVVRDTDLSWAYLTSDGGTWPASPYEGAMGAMGRFSMLQSVSPAKDQTLPDDAHSLQIELANGTVYTIRYSTEALGGKLLASVASSKSPGEPPVHIVNSNDLLPLANPGPASWRVGNAVPGVRDASRIYLETPDETIQLARLDGRWTLRQPVAGRANEEAVASLLDTLALLQIQRFIDHDQPDASTTGFASSRLTVRTETDVRTIDDQGRTRNTVRSKSLIIGADADPSGRFAYAAPSSTSSLLMLLPNDRLTQISTTARNYLALTASSLTAEDIALITVSLGYNSPTERGFRRSQGEWRELNPDGTSSEIDAEQIDELLAFLLEEPGEPEPASTDEIRPAARITLYDLSGRTLQTIDFAYTADATPFARAGNIDVLYYDFTPPALLEIGRAHV